MAATARKERPLKVGDRVALSVSYILDMGLLYFGVDHRRHPCVDVHGTVVRLIRRKAGKVAEIAWDNERDGWIRFLEVDVLEQSFKPAPVELRLIRGGKA